MFGVDDLVIKDNLQIVVSHFISAFFSLFNFLPSELHSPTCRLAGGRVHLLIDEREAN